MGRKVIGIVGSYRKGHVIDTLVSEVLSGAEASGAEVEKIYLVDKHIEFCRNCRSCTQEKGSGPRGMCVHDDDMEDILAKVDSADGIVLGSPVNFGNVTAVTRRFMERLLMTAYWPWGAKFPQARRNQTDKRAVIVVSSACPAFIARIMMRGPLSALKAASKCLGARVERSLYFGKAGQEENGRPERRFLRKARAVGQLLGL